MEQVKMLGRACRESTEDQHLKLEKLKKESGIGVKRVSRSRGLSTVSNAAESQEF